MNKEKERERLRQKIDSERTNMVDIFLSLFDRRLLDKFLNSNYALTNALSDLAELEKEGKNNEKKKV
ncbi:MAG: hypothetical protein SVO01_00345 [Thermotogota bacterium]|nr:hypothetical protein [Thermotogota bacterium]